jgi:histone acetyltransferase
LIKERIFNVIPGIEGSGWKFKDYENLNKENGQNSNNNFLTQCRNIITKLKTNKNSWPFLTPVDAKNVPDYYELIKEPMGKFNYFKILLLTDVQTLERNLEMGCYTRDSFVKDLKKIFNNAKTYNKSSSIYHKYAIALENSVEDEVKNLKDN